MELTCANAKHISGMKFASPEFFIPLTQTVNRPICLCKFLNNHWPSQTSCYTFSVQQKATNLHETYCIKVWWNGLRKYGTCFATFLQKELNGDVRHSTARVQTCLATNQVVVAGCEKLLQKVESSSTFSTKSAHVAHFTGPRQTRFAASDVTPVYGTTPA